MKYNELGKTGLKVSEIGFGGEWLGSHTQEECCAIIDKLEQSGVNILDCWMCDPYIRNVLGNALKGHREKWIIQGHIGSTWQHGQYVRTRNMDKVIPAFEDLLKRLQTDYIDIGMIHYVDDMNDWNNLHNNGFLDYMLDLKSKGIIRHIGMSTHSPIMARTAVEEGIVEMLMFPVNPAFDFMPATSVLSELYNAKNADKTLGSIDPERSELYRLCKEKGVGLTVMKPFAAGSLLSAYRSPFGVALTVLQCVHYPLTVSGAAAIMAGLESVEQVNEILSYETASDEEKNYEKILSQAPMHSSEKKCMYCGHCQPCPAGIDIASVNRLYDLAVKEGRITEELRKVYNELKKNASDCIGCGGCETRCPFGVSITERMELTKELFI